MIIYPNVSLLPERELTLSCPIYQSFHLITLSILLGAQKKVLTHLLRRFQALLAQVSVSSTLPDRVRDPAVRGDMHQSSAIEDQRFI